MIKEIPVIESLDIISNIYRNSLAVLKELQEEHKDIKFTSFLHGRLNQIAATCEMALMKMDNDYAMQIIREHKFDKKL